MNNQIDKIEIWKIIEPHVGESNSITQSDLTDEYIYRLEERISERAVRRGIRELRQEGYPILSSPHFPNGGYFVPETHQEVVEWQERMHDKAVALLAIIKPVIKTCQDMFPGKVEQLEMFEVEKVG